MRVTTVFTAHPASAGETYGEHMRVALSFALPLAKAAKLGQNNNIAPGIDHALPQGS
jgi:carotenoid cleavage dioxygenase-like enzyme